MGFFDDLYGAVTDKASQLYDEAKGELGDWWMNTEDSEPLPATYQQTVVQERLADGASIPRLETASNNTGATVGNVGYPLQNKTTLYIGLGVGAVVLLVLLMLLMKGRK